MPISFIKYKLIDGYIDNWLVAGPQIIKINPQKGDQSLRNLRKEIYQALFLTNSGISKMPVERGPLTEGIFKVGDYQGAWSYWCCDEDHLVVQSDRYREPVFLRSWAYSQLHFNKEKLIAIIINTYGPYRIWINDELITQSETFSEHQPLKYVETTTMKKGLNEILFCFEQVGLDSCKLAFSLRLCEPDNPLKPIFDGKCQIPTTIPHVNRRNEFEHAFNYGFLMRDIFAAESGVEFKWSKRIFQSAIVNARLQTPEGQIYAEAEGKGKPGDSAHFGYAMSFPQGPYEVTLMPTPREMYEENIRIQSSQEIWVMGNHPYNFQPGSLLADRRSEALRQASQYSGNLFAEIAKIATGRWSIVNLSSIRLAIEEVRKNFCDSSLILLGLIGMVYRFGDHQDFPKELLVEIQTCATNHAYQTQYVLQGSYRESDELLRLCCEFLAGQKYPDISFAEDGNPGARHVTTTEPLITEWLFQHCQLGFEQWDSDAVLADTVLALSHLIDMSNSDNLFDLAGTLMEKILIGLAINSFQGGLASSSGLATTMGIKGALAQAVSGITNVFWGQGIYNHYLPGYVSAALLKNYELPPIILELAQTGDVISGKERHHNTSKYTHRCADFMLSSVQDYRPGTAGDREHIWQATLGVEAVVFTNHPGCASQDDSMAPNYWLGNGKLPRVAQWRDLLIAIYNIEDHEQINFTHSYFPTFAFDEYVIRKNWAFARKGNGFLALTASQRMDLMKQGKSAFRELRVPGRQTIWVCQMGNETQYGNFERFQKMVLQLPLEFGGLGIRMQTLNSESLEFDWKQSLSLNQQVVPLDYPNHYDYPEVYAEYPAKQMDVLFKDYFLRLNFHRKFMS
jgi:hypothetical protein